MKFLNLNTGYSFDGLWKNDQTKGYIFWFPNAQSVGLTHVMPICVLTEKPDMSDEIDPEMSVPELTLTMEDNPIFSFITHREATVSVDGYEFHEPNYSKMISVTPVTINNHYAYFVNIAGKSDDAGEFVCKVTIGDEGFIRIGADFYEEYEPIYVNLSNMGVEISPAVQKAIYDSNVHEDFIDNILVNRKFKELMSNYWDVIANKGSYKSLANALEWFEWNDNLKIKEIWRHNEADRIVYDDREIMSIFENKIEDAFTNFVRTTYVSLYCSLQEELDTYDVEGNPMLKDVVFKWSKDDIQLKISLMAEFFGMHFLPIHMSILHATAEDTVFTNAIKALHAADVKRDDTFGDFGYVKCKVEDTYKMTNVRAQATSETVFGIESDVEFFGVDEFPSDLKTDGMFYSYYTGPGVIVPLNIVLPNQTSGDAVQCIIADYTDIDGTMKRVRFDKIFKVKKNEIRIYTNFLARTAQHYAILFTFILKSGKTLTKRIEFNVEDADNLNINIYRVKSKDDTLGFTKDDFVDMTSSRYMFQIQANDGEQTWYTQYLPYMLPTDDRFSTYKGVKLTRTVVIDVENGYGTNLVLSEEAITFARAIMMNDYLEFAKYRTTADGSRVPTHLIFVSKKFYAELPSALNDNRFGYHFNIIRNDLGFYPQFHYLDKMQGNTIEDYTVTEFDALCCAAEIENGKATIPFRYGHLIEDAEWTFRNTLTGELALNPKSAQTPFATKANGALKSGYYDVIFKYSLTNGTIGECRLDSAFRIIRP